jgi:hypothetical protein
MIVHVVMFRPRASLDGDQRRALASAFESALNEIPSIRRAHVGRRIRVGRAYEQLMRADYPYAAVIEFDSRDALLAYLDHPSHAQLASTFFESFEDALMYDFELQEGTVALASMLRDTQ